MPNTLDALLIVSLLLWLGMCSVMLLFFFIGLAHTAWKRWIDRRAEGAVGMEAEGATDHASFSPGAGRR